MKKRTLAMLLALIMLLGCLAGCSVEGEKAPAEKEPAAEEKAPAEDKAEEKAEEQADEKTDEPILLGFSLFDNTQPWAVAYSKSVFAEAEARGFEYVYADAQNDPAKQVTDVEDLIAQNIDYLVMTPIEFEAGGACLEVAKAAGVPVVMWGRSARGEAGVDYETCVTGDFVWEGTAAGEWLVANCDGSAKVVEIAGTVGADAATDRQSGFADAIAAEPGIEIVASQPADFVRADAQKVMENLIQSLGADGFDTVYTHSDEMGIGAVLALKAAGLKPGTDVTVISIDGQKELVQMIADGDVNCDVC